MGLWNKADMSSSVVSKLSALSTYTPHFLPV